GKVLFVFADIAAVGVHVPLILRDVPLVAADVAAILADILFVFANILGVLLNVVARGVRAGGGSGTGLALGPGADRKPAWTGSSRQASTHNLIQVHFSSLRISIACAIPISLHE